jgi:hypothetical protein
MRILLVGSKSQFALALQNHFNSKGHFVTEMRNTDCNEWRFGQDLNTDDLRTSDRIIFLAWSKKDVNQSINEFARFVSAVRKFSHSSNLLFISSFSVFNRTRYGISKLLGEEIAEASGAKYIRLPLITDLVNTQEIRRVQQFIELFKRVPFSKIWGGDIFRVSIPTVITEIESWVIDPDSFRSSSLSEVGNINIIDLFQRDNPHKIVESYFLSLVALCLKKVIEIFGNTNRSVDSFYSYFNNKDSKIIDLYFKKEISNE